MKLKKIASLALAGLMAVSMLAGCGDNSSNGNGTVVEPGTSSSIVEALNNAEFEDEDVKVTFTYSSELENDIKGALAGKAEGYTLTKDNMAAMNGIQSANNFFNDDSNKANADKQTATIMYVAANAQGKMYNSTNCGNEKVLLKKVVDDVEDLDLVATTKTDATKDGDTYYDYTYTGDVAMVSVKANNGVTYYYVVYVIEQSAAKMEYKV